MIIVSGRIILNSGQRDAFIQASTPAMRLARTASGCRAFVVAADPLEADVANVYEEWESEADLLAFRSAGPSSDMRAMISSVHVRRHDVASSGPA